MRANVEADMASTKSVRIRNTQFQEEPWRINSLDAWIIKQA